MEIVSNTEFEAGAIDSAHFDFSEQPLPVFEAEQKIEARFHGSIPRWRLAGGIKIDRRTRAQVEAPWLATQGNGINKFTIEGDGGRVAAETDLCIRAKPEFFHDWFRKYMNAEIKLIRIGANTGPDPYSFRLGV